LDVVTKPITPFREIGYYLDQIKKRNIFTAYQEPKQAPPPAVKEEPPPPPPEPKVPIEQKAKNLKLIGISWGDNPKAMIRDTGTQEVLFLSEGEKVQDTDLTIKQVTKDEVILTSEGQEMSLL